MSKITLVEPQKKNPHRFNIYLDGVFGFGADEDTVVKFRLVPGKVIEPTDLEKILFETEVGKLMGRMYNLFSIRMRSEKEVRDYIRNLSFKRKFRSRAKSKLVEQEVKEPEEISQVVVESLIQNLKNKGLLNDEVFAKELAGLCEVYVNDAFSVSHRGHASIVGVTKFLPSYGGLLLKKELEMLDKVITNPERPFIAIVGGIKKDKV